MQPPGAQKADGGGIGGDDAAALAIHPEARNWLAHGLRHIAEQFALFVRTAVEITRHPRRFAASWAAGEFRAFNPLAFLATAGGITGTLGLFVDKITQQSG